MAHFGNIICVENGQLIHGNDTLFSGLVGKCSSIPRESYYSHSFPGWKWKNARESAKESFISWGLQGLLTDDGAFFRAKDYKYYLYARV